MKRDVPVDTGDLRSTCQKRDDGRGHTMLMAGGPSQISDNFVDYELHVEFGTVNMWAPTRYSLYNAALPPRMCGKACLSDWTVFRLCGYAAGGAAAILLKPSVEKAEPFRTSYAAEPRKPDPAVDNNFKRSEVRVGGRQHVATGASPWTGARE